MTDTPDDDLTALPMEERLERSSLGTPEARAFRDQTPPAVVDELLRRLRGDPDDRPLVLVFEVIRLRDDLARLRQAAYTHLEAPAPGTRDRLIRAINVTGPKVIPSASGRTIRDRLTDAIADRTGLTHDGAARFAGELIAVIWPDDEDDQ